MEWPWRIGVAVFAATLVLGLLHAVRSTGRPPGVATRDYGGEIQRALEQGDTARALEQMRLATILRVDDPRGQEPLMRQMAETAHRAGDADSEIFALRWILVHRSDDRNARLLLSTALLARPGRTMADLKESADNAEIAVQIDPHAVTAWLNLAQINAEIGHEPQAQALRQRAAREQPSMDFSAAAAHPGYWDVP